MDSGQARLWIPVRGRSEQLFGSLFVVVSSKKESNPTSVFPRGICRHFHPVPKQVFRGWNRVEDVLGVLARRWDGLVRGWVLVMSSDGSGSTIQRAWDGERYKWVRGVGVSG